MIGHAAPTVKANGKIPFQFRPLPVAVGDLPSTAAILFSVLIDESKRRGWRTRLTNAALAARLNRSVATVKRLLALLEARGLIQREHVADGRVRTATRITWAGVAQSCATEQPSVAQSQYGGGSPVSRGVAHSCATNSESPSQSAFQTAGVSTSGEEKPESSPPLSAEGIAAAIADGMRQAVGGEHAAMIFDVEPSTPTASTSTPSTAPTAKPATTPTTPATKTTAPYNGLDLRRVGVSAVAACFSPAFGAVRNTPEKLNRQLDELRARRRGPSPAPGPGGASSSARPPQTDHCPESGRVFGVRL